MAKRSASSPDTIPAPDKIARLMALAAIEKMEGNIDKVLFLRSAGFVNSEIAALLNISNNQVAVTLIKSRKRKKRKKSN